ncbi:MAG: hypothetical protein RLY92_1166, partial [Chloroflexota bacterium]
SAANGSLRMPPLCGVCFAQGCSRLPLRYCTETDYASSRVPLRHLRGHGQARLAQPAVSLHCQQQSCRALFTGARPRAKRFPKPAIRCHCPKSVANIVPAVNPARRRCRRAHLLGFDHRLHARQLTLFRQRRETVGGHIQNQAQHQTHWHRHTQRLRVLQPRRRSGWH